MPSVKSLVSKYRAYVVTLILLFSEVMPIYFYYIIKGLVYITIIAPSSRQPSFYFKCIKLNIYVTCNI